MSWRVRALISSGCKCILVQVGQLIYSSKCNSINLFLSVLSMHCTNLPGEKCGAGMPDFSMSFWSFSQNRGIGLFYLKCKTKKQRGCVNASYLIWKTWSRVGERLPQTKRKVVACPMLVFLLLFSSACFRYALLMFAAAVRETKHSQWTSLQGCVCKWYVCVYS